MQDSAFTEWSFIGHSDFQFLRFRTDKYTCAQPIHDEIHYNLHLKESEVMLCLMKDWQNIVRERKFISCWIQKKLRLKDFLDKCRDLALENFDHRMYVRSTANLSPKSSGHSGLFHRKKQALTSL